MTRPVLTGTALGVSLWVGFVVVHFWPVYQHAKRRGWV